MTDFTVNLHFLVILYIVAIACAAIFGGACLEYRQQKVVRTYLVIVTLYAGWLAGNLFLLLSPDYAQKEMYAHLRIIFLTLIPPCWVYFTKELFRPPGQASSSKYFFTIFIIPLLIIGISLIWGTSPMLFRDIQPLTAFGISTLQWKSGPLLYVHFIYSYVLLGIASYYCVKGLKYHRGLKPRYGLLLLFSLVLFLVVEFTGMFLIPEVRFLGFSALTQVFSTVSFYYVLHRQQVVRSFSQNNHILFESLPTPIVLIDRHEKVVLYNSRARDLFSLNVSSVGSRFHDVLPQQIRNDLPSLDSISKGHIVSLNAGGDINSVRYFKVICEPFKHESIYRDGRLVIFNEVTELKKTTQTNQRLMSLMSHDLLGNLSSLEILSRNKSEMHWELVADTAKSSVDLLKNLLLWSATQGDLYEPNRERLPAKDLIQSCMQQFTAIAESKRLALKLNETDESIQINVDTKMFSAILRNILSNAIKHAPVNSTIDIDCLRNDTNTLLRVRDRGPGIDKAIVKEIFTHGGDRPLARDSSSEGYGIGLFVILHFLKLHGGKLEVSSLSSGGCSVTAIFPI